MSTPEPLPPRANAPRAPRVGARQFHTDRAERRRRRTDVTVTVVAVVVLLLAVYVLVTARPSAPGGGPANDSSDAPPILVALGTPVVSQVNCSGGGTVTAERVAWINATEPITTGDAYPRVGEVADGDFVGDPDAVAEANATSLCDGPQPNPTARWYMVFEDPNGTNALTYTVADGWATIGGGAWNVLIPDGGNLTVVEYPSLAHTGFNLSIIGFANGAQIEGTVVL